MRCHPCLHVFSARRAGGVAHDGGRRTANHGAWAMTPSRPHCSLWRTTDPHRACGRIQACQARGDAPPALPHGPMAAYTSQYVTRRIGHQRGDRPIQCGSRVRGSPPRPAQPRARMAAPDRRRAETAHRSRCAVSLSATAASAATGAGCRSPVRRGPFRRASALGTVCARCRSPRIQPMQQMTAPGDGLR
jgi:hypothetical protein